MQPSILKCMNFPFLLEILKSSYSLKKISFNMRKDFVTFFDKIFTPFK